MKKEPSVFIIDYFSHPYLFVSLIGILCVGTPTTLMVLSYVGLLSEYGLVCWSLMFIFLIAIPIFPLANHCLYRFFVKKAKVIFHGDLQDLITIEIDNKIILDAKKIRKLNAYNGSRAFRKLKTFTVKFADNSKSHVFGAWDDDSFYCDMAAKSDAIKRREKMMKKAKTNIK